MRAERGRLTLMVSAILVSLIAVVVVLGAQTVLQREIAANYLGTRPASATFELSEHVDQGLLEGIRTMPEVATATGREVVRARVQVGDDWRPMLIFVTEEFDDLRLNLFYRESGAWPPPTGTVLLERSALSMAEADLGSTLRVMAPNGSIKALGVSGVVHDPGLAPAWQERSAYAYATPATLAAMGESPELHELRIAFRAETKDAKAVQNAADELSQALRTRGLHVQEIRVPPPGEHPHQRQMTTVLSMLLIFAGLALVLSSVLVATSLAAMLARQVREIGVMKAVGATTSQLAMMYGVVVASIGLSSVAISVPIGLVGARAFAANIAKMLNFNLSDKSVPLWVLFVALASGLVVPLVIATVPISRATRMSVRSALEQHGASPPSLSVWLLWLPRALRDAMRRPSRFVLTVGLLATGGALFMTSLAVSKAWVKNVDKIYESRFYDVEIRLRTTGDSALISQMQSLPGVRNVELWDYGPAAFARTGRVDLVHTYPDRGHGSLSVMAPPVTTELVRFPLLAGRWLLPADDTGVVLNHVAAAQRPGIRIGDEVLLSMGGHVNRLRLLGIVEEVGSPGIAYVTHGGFLAFGVPESSGRLVRLATIRGTAGQRALVIPRIESLLAQRSVGVESVVPFAELRTAIGDHIAILTRALVAMAVVLAIVGILGLGSAMGTSVVERTRDIGVMKAIGGTSRRIIRAIVAEGLATATASYLVAIVLSLPLTWVVQGIIGRIGFLAPLPFVLSPAAILGWAGLLGLSTLAATLPPAYRAAALSVREALAVTG
ncbi:MAG TPA: FtsX-like permease family protein [Polyangiaceae bacterium]|nr:FtsX-like permease family protein [Polyangiaceae bacterium]